MVKNQLMVDGNGGNGWNQADDQPRNHQDNRISYSKTVLHP